MIKEQVHAEIKCPKCGEVFQVDESGYAAIVRQVRDKEFEKELSERKAQYLSEKENAVLLAQTQTRQELAEEISRLQAKLAAAESARQLAEADAVPGRKNFCLNRKRLCPKGRSDQPFKCQNHICTGNCGQGYRPGGFQSSCPERKADQRNGPADL